MAEQGFDSEAPEGMPEEAWVRNQQMREISGSIDDSRYLVAFLYVLMRDHLTPGHIEQIMESHVECKEPGTVREYSNGWIATHAQYLAERLTEDDA